MYFVDQLRKVVRENHCHTCMYTLYNSDLIGGDVNRDT